MTNQGKLVSKPCIPWLVNRNLLLKIVKCRNIFSSFYRNIVCKNLSSVYKPLICNAKNVTNEDAALTIFDKNLH